MPYIYIYINVHAHTHTYRYIVMNKIDKDTSTLLANKHIKPVETITLIAPLKCVELLVL